MTGATRSYRDLIVWQRAMDLMVECYAIARRLPNFELFGLASQLRRAAISVPTNIAEGNGRAHRAEYRQFLSIAQGSLNEVQSLLEGALRLGFIDATRLHRALTLVDTVGRLLTGLQRSLATGSAAPRGRAPRPQSRVPR